MHLNGRSRRLCIPRLLFSVLYVLDIFDGCDCRFWVVGIKSVFLVVTSERAFQRFTDTISLPTIHQNLCVCCTLTDLCWGQYVIDLSRTVKTKSGFYYFFADVYYILLTRAWFTFDRWNRCILVGHIIYEYMAHVVL